MSLSRISFIHFVTQVQSNRKLVIFGLIAPVLFLAVISLYWVCVPSIVPGLKGIRGDSFTEQNINDNSKILKDSISSSGIEMQYQVGTIAEPFVGVSLCVENATDCIDLRGVKELVLTLDPARTNSMNITLLFNIPEFTLLHLLHTHQYAMTEITVRPGQSIYRIPLTAFQIPLWWYSMNRASRSELPVKIDYSKCSGILFSNHDLASRGDTLSMAISSIRFSRNLGNIVPAIALFCLLYSVVLILLYRFSGRRNRPYEPVVLTSYLSNDAENIISILGKKYCEPDFSMKQLMLETRLAEDRIRTVLKKVYNKTMKEYITDVRITESKRLLRNTDRPISEIATAVGYKHVSSFNHIFKEIEHISPREYRKTSI